MRYALWSAALLAAVLVTGPAVLSAQTTDNGTQSAQAATHEATGVVTAVEPDAHPQTVVVQTKAGNQDMTVGADVFDQTKITQGNAEKSLADLKVGDRVWIRWKKTPDTLVADSIRILPSSGQPQG